jgi:hypothetical protein
MHLNPVRAKLLAPEAPLESFVWSSYGQYLTAPRELERLGWAESELTRQRKGDRHEVALARRLRAETTMSLAWIAQRLRMGSWSYVSNLLRTTKTANSED